MKHEFHPAALQEYAEAVQFFAQQDKQQDFIDTIALGAGFANENAIFRVISAPERWPIVDGQIRRYLTIKFSYFILYRVDPDRIVIAAIASCRRDPNYWRERL
jgi:toxin ParE1/3/4